MYFGCITELSSRFNAPCMHTIGGPPARRSNQTAQCNSWRVNGLTVVAPALVESLSLLCIAFRMISMPSVWWPGKVITIDSPTVYLSTVLLMSFDVPSTSWIYSFGPRALRTHSILDRIKSDTGHKGLMPGVKRARRATAHHNPRSNNFPRPPSLQSEEYEDPIRLAA
jgi:hypothetical protein